MYALSDASAVPALTGLPQSITLYIDPRAACPMVHGGATDSQTVAKVRVTFSGPDWCRLVFQFSHELCHILANSWGPSWQPDLPHAWLEEACCGALSLLALERMAKRWTSANIFGDAGYGIEFRKYLQGQIVSFQQLASLDVISSPAWWRANAVTLSGLHELANLIKPFSILMYDAFVADAALWHDLRALNRWERTVTLSLSDHLSEWERQCSMLGTPGRLPKWCRDRLLG